MIEIDSKYIVNMSNKLIKANRSTLPIAVRSTLNDMAFDVKKNQLMPALKNSGMTIRNEYFFKKYSGVEKAVGFEIIGMYSQVGMIPSGSASKSVNRLEKQDIGGTLADRNFIPDENIRIGKSRIGKVKGSGFLNKQKLIGTKINFGDKTGYAAVRANSGTCSLDIKKLDIGGGDIYLSRPRPDRPRVPRPPPRRSPQAAPPRRCRAPGPGGR